ncbi:unnamed protein product [Cladocopium goreaui]|uniref:Retrovirus-related Pol polyprotein from transposon RE2 (Retro element 2) (AtRE2) n=1 Tax=Cladocopium goreaui TaxID=2562237 RepID=A0A9P1GCG5_9DINO|nr:unnamed protein product [Cladocopium goreaui]
MIVVIVVVVVMGVGGGDGDCACAREDFQHQQHLPELCEIFKDTCGWFYTYFWDKANIWGIGSIQRRPCPTFFEPEPEPEVREDLDARRSFNEKLQAVITLAPQVGHCFLEIGYLHGRQELRRREIQLLGAEGRPLGELPVELEFRECLIRLKEEKNGVDPERDGFGLPTVDEESASEGPDSEAPTANASPDASERRRRYARIPTDDPGQPPAEDDDLVLSVSDSFILEQLRGWRLLTSASLSTDEWRDVLGTTQGKLDYVSISDALQVLYDEQMTGGTRLQPGHPQQPLYHGQHLQAYIADEHYDDDWSSMSSSSSWDEWGDDGWSSWNAALTWSEDPWSYDSWWPEDGEDEADANAAQEGDPNASEASAAEAQKMEQLLADGRRKSYKGKSFDPWKGKGKGKAPVNAYALNHYGLEMELQTQHNGPVEHAMLATKKVATPRKTQIPREIPPGSGMIDSGATCSAGPETSVQRLVTKIMEADAAAQIRVETKDQPRFRFGSGKWGQALYKLTNASVDGKFSQAFEYMVNRRMKLSFNSSVRLMGNRLPSLQPRQLPLQVAMPKDKDKSDMQPPDESRRMEGDPRDPRHQRSQWPCKGTHAPSKEMSNRYGIWVNCLQCGYRLWYKPRVGSPANSMVTMNGTNVKRALDELQGLLPPQAMPTEELVRAMIEKVVAEERIKTMLMDFEKTMQKNVEKINKAKSAATAAKAKGYASPIQRPRTPTPEPGPSPASSGWQQVSPSRMDLNMAFEHLTAEEKERLMQLAAERAVQPVINVNISSGTELEPAWIKMLSTAPVVMDPFKELCDGDDHQAHLCSGLPDGDLFMEDDANVPDDAVVPAEVQPSEQDQRAWKAKLDRFHRQAGHPTARNMARMMADAQLPRWKIKMALEHVCPYCQEQKGGGISSKQINPASMRNLPGPWEQVGIDVSEWEVPGENIKVKFVIMMDLCTKYKVTDVLFKNKHGTIKNESAEEMIRSVSLRWLSDKPRPRILVPDNAKSLTAKKFVDYMSDLCIEVIYPPDHESWAHGLVERGHQLVKETASRIHASSPDQDPEISLALATAAVNSTEYNKGYSSIQWAFGRQAELTDDELRQHLQLPIDRQQDQFARLLTNRQSAEEHARKARADHVGPTGPMPPMRISGKKKPSDPEPIELEDDDFGNMPHGPLREDRRFSTTSSTPMVENKEPYLDSPEDGLPDPVPEPESKRARYEDEDDKEDMYMKHLQIFNQIDSGYLMDIELDLASNRQKKAFQRNPSLYLAKKLAGSEVCFRRLSANEKELFKRAMNSEVSSFIKTEAVRRCLSFEEQQEAKRSGRVLKSRWVLVWKSVPEESRAEALADARENENTVHSSDGTRKAKARIVVLGYQHPDLLDPSLATTAPVQSQLFRNLSLCVVAQRRWQLEGLDMSTAFLQTGKTEEDRRIWMQGVPELNRALGAEPHEAVRILKNVYGNATAPRGLWEDVDKTFCALGAKRLIGDSSFWIWTKPNPNPRNQFDTEQLIGFVGGHVDDFNRAGDLQDPEWLRIREAIDKSYKWGTVKINQYRHTGLDINVKTEGNDFLVEVDQNYYVEGLMDLTIAPERLNRTDNPQLTPDEVSACRAGLGAVQWAATQTQVQACARANLLLSQITSNHDMNTAKEIQELIREVRSNPVSLKFWNHPELEHWQDVTIVTLADQAHANRPSGDSTGGLLTLLGGPAHREGAAGRLSIVGWRTWKLKRKAISTNDGEVQSMLEGEDANFRTRFMWCQLNGAPIGDDVLNSANNMVKTIYGIVGTDSKGGFDAVTRSEGPMLGLTNARSALQAYQLREQLDHGGAKLIWLAGDWNLSDALTKKPQVARQSLLQFLRNFVWRLHYDPKFVTSEKKAKQQGRGALQQMRDLQCLQPFSHVTTF